MAVCFQDVYSTCMTQTELGTESCQWCKVSNDNDFVFCKICGKKRQEGDLNQMLTADELKGLNERILYLDGIQKSTNYGKQKSKLES